MANPEHIESNRDNSRAAMLSVVVAVYNEAQTLASVIQKLLSIPNLLEVIIVDDGSTDGSGEVGHALAARWPQVHFEKLSQNSGKTAALKVGFQLTRGEVVVVQDADLEYDP